MIKLSRKKEISILQAHLDFITNILNPVIIVDDQTQ